MLKNLTFPSSRPLTFPGLPHKSRRFAAALLLTLLTLGVVVGPELKAESPAITSIVTKPCLTISCTVGEIAQIQYTNRLGGTNWVVLTNMVVTESPYEYIDKSAPKDGARFYRVLTSANPNSIDMKLIPAGWFTMGDTFGNTAALPLHSVFVSAFYMDKYEVTKTLWDDVKTWATANGYGINNAVHGKAANHPVTLMTWYDAVKWCNARSEKAGLTPAYYTDAGLTTVYRTGIEEPYVNWNGGYRLPTESEWERAARGGSDGHRFPWTDVGTITHSQANYYSSSSYAYDISPTRGYHPTYQTNGTPYTSPVGSFAPNSYGLYDMSGNVMELCWDWYGPYPSNSQIDPRGPRKDSYHVARGGSWETGGGLHSQVAYREHLSPESGYSYNGFRTVLPTGQP